MQSELKLALPSGPEWFLLLQGQVLWIIIKLHLVTAETIHPFEDLVERKIFKSDDD